jgi:cytochrome c5
VKLIRVLKSRAVQVGLVSVLAVMSGSLSADTSRPVVMQLAQLSENFDVERAYMQSCWACHNSGAAGAPKVGDAAAWSARMEKGIDAVVTNAVNGLNAMPAKGMCFTCTNDDIKALVQYMVDNSK